MRCSRRWTLNRRRCAFTLIEVLAGLTLLSTLLVAVVMARGRYVHQSVSAERRLEAVEVADELLTQWWQDPAAFPVDDSGTVNEDMRWRTRQLSQQDLEDLGAMVVRLELFVDDRAPRDSPGDERDEPILVIDVLAPMVSTSPQPEG